jgi:hypothetical protein
MRKMMFIGVAMSVLFTLLSCNDVNGNESDGTDVPLRGSVKQPPGEPAPVIIKDDVKKWMAEQLLSKNNERKQIEIYDMYFPDIDGILGISATYSDGKDEYFLDGKKISAEKYDSIRASVSLDLYCKRNLSIPGEMVYDGDCRIWTVLMTAEEIAELSKKYDNLRISFPPRYVNF